MRRKLGVGASTDDSPIRVLHVCGALAGGVGGVLMGYYRHIDHSRVQFDFVTHGEPAPEIRAEVEALGGSVSVVTPKSRGLWQNLRETRRLIGRATPHQVVHVHTASPTSFVYLAVAWVGGKRVRVAHSHATSLEAVPGSVQFRIHRLLRPVLRWCATDLLACSVAAGRWLYGNDRGVHTYANAIEVQRYARGRSARETIRRSLGLGAEFVIGHVGRFAEQKNHEFLVRVFAEVARLDPRAVLLLVGDGPLREQVETDVSRAGLEERVRFVGARNDVADLLGAMDVVVMPSKFEGLPVSVVEAQAAGLPCLLSRAITDEVVLTALVEFEDLEAAPTRWAERALAMAAGGHCPEAADRLAQAGYDLKAAGRRLTEFYLRRVGAIEPKE